jgi:hypothetical protein
MSDEKKRDANGGVLINQKTQDTILNFKKWIKYTVRVSNLKIQNFCANFNG